MEKMLTHTFAPLIHIYKLNIRDNWLKQLKFLFSLTFPRHLCNKSNVSDQFQNFLILRITYSTYVSLTCGNLTALYFQK